MNLACATAEVLGSSVIVLHSALRIPNHEEHEELCNISTIAHIDKKVRLFLLNKSKI